MDAAADPSTRAVVPGDGHQPDQKPHPDEYPLARDNEQADPETPAERGPEAVDRSTQPPAASAEATAYANADAGHDTADEPTRAPSDGKLARATLPTTRWSPRGTDLIEGLWRELQLRFAADPRSATGEGAGLVEEAMQSRTDAITAQKQTLDGWQSADREDTEVLRVAMRRSRGFLDHPVDL